jgi:hypothetical protein
MSIVFQTFFTEKMVKFSKLFHHFSALRWKTWKKVEKGWKRFDNFTIFSVKNVWKTIDIFHCKLCWKFWISQPVPLSSSSNFLDCRISPVSDISIILAVRCHWHPSLGHRMQGVICTTFSTNDSTANLARFRFTCWNQNNKPSLLQVVVVPILLPMVYDPACFISDHLWDTLELEDQWPLLLFCHRSLILVVLCCCFVLQLGGLQSIKSMQPLRLCMTVGSRGDGFNIPFGCCNVAHMHVEFLLNWWQMWLCCL